MSGPPPPPPRGRDQPPGRDREPPPPPPSRPPRRTGPPRPPRELESASLALRLGAKAVDWLVLLVPLALLFVLALPLFLVMSFAGPPSAVDPLSGNTPVMVGLRGVYGALTLAYFTWGESTRGYTPGKRVLRLRVVDERGETPTVTQALLRNLWMGLFVLPWPFGAVAQLLAAVAIAVTVSHDPAGRGWHDELADLTRVVRAP